MSSKDLSNERRNYIKEELIESNIATSPFQQFERWFDEVGKSGFLEPNAMVLATASKEAKPSARMVLLKSFDDNGFVFYSNYSSRKGHEIEQNNQASILFFWDIIERQVRIEGTLEKVDVALSEKYFSSRPFESQLSAIVSDQSAEISGRKILEDKLDEVRHSSSVERPANWGGYVLKPNYFEFWQGRANRLHDRIVYAFENNAWKIKRLAP